MELRPRLSFLPVIAVAALLWVVSAHHTAAADPPARTDMQPPGEAEPSTKRSEAAGGRIYWVNQADPAAADANPGDKARPFKTISAAARLAKAGDTVVVRAGVYRERVSPAFGGEEGKPVVYMAAPGEQVVVRGSEVGAPNQASWDDALKLRKGWRLVCRFQVISPGPAQAGGGKLAFDTLKVEQVKE